jgi:para-aminobenzoate synthetase/4-amino-4-deoxychorismate lyase
VPEVFAALFPSGSVTGAPKIRSMEIIHELEGQARGIYCGSIGCWKSKREAVFNVAIRTATLDLHSSTGVYPVGAGITWGSEVESEFQECKMKAKVLDTQETEFQLFESLLWDGEFYLLDRHLARLNRSAAYFDFPFDETHLRQELSRNLPEHSGKPWKIRMRLARNGAISIESQTVQSPGVQRVGIARKSVNSSSIFLYHKTTCRKVYDEAIEGWDGYDDMLLWNQDGELTESTRANVVVQIDGTKYTPPISCGLLGGTFREELLEQDELTERAIWIDELPSAEKIWCINSVRQWIEIDVDFSTNPTKDIEKK